MKNEFQSLSLQDLNLQKAGIEDRIQRLQRDLKAPFEQDLSEQAMEISQRLILDKILNAEIEYLKKVNLEIAARAVDINA
jgi:hypothetical protein